MALSELKTKYYISGGGGFQPQSTGKTICTRRSKYMVNAHWSMLFLCKDFYYPIVDWPMAKSSVLSRCVPSFLRELATEINLSPRNYKRETKEELLKTLENRLSSSDIETVFEMYTLCFDIPEIAEAVRPRDVMKLAADAEKYLSCEEYLHEVVVRKRRCDIVGFKGDSLIAIEIKSARDDFRTLVGQIKDYELWANEIYLVYDEAHAEKVRRSSLEDMNIGLLEVSKTGNITPLSAPIKLHHDSRSLLSLIDRVCLRSIAKRYGVSINGDREKIISQLSTKLDERSASYFLKSYLRDKTKLVEK